MNENVDEDTGHPPSPSLWRENHGNLLLAVIVGVFLVGTISLFISQHRLRKPSFPDSSAIQQVSEQAEPELLGNNRDANLTIVVIGAANDEGWIKLAIYDSIDKFMTRKKAVKKETLRIQSGEATLEIPAGELPEKFAIAVYHDENNDDELNLNRLGIPVERYGFSRNARGLTGPPSFSDVVVERAKLPRKLEISIR